MNVVDPQQSIAFYTDAFEQTQRTVVAGWDALRSEDSYILFSRVTSPRSAEWDTPIWHFGWNSPDVVATHERLVSRGVSFFRVPPPSGHMIAPDGNDVEITPGGGSGPGPTAFNHVHLMSDAPLCAANWYVAMLGLRREADAEAPDDCDVPFAERRDPANQIHQPNTRLYAGDILIFIYPNQRLVALSQRPVEDRGVLVSSRGRVLTTLRSLSVMCRLSLRECAARGSRSSRMCTTSATRRSGRRWSKGQTRSRSSWSSDRQRLWSRDALFHAHILGALAPSRHACEKRVSLGPRRGPGGSRRYTPGRGSRLAWPSCCEPHPLLMGSPRSGTSRPGDRSERGY